MSKNRKFIQSLTKKRRGKFSSQQKLIFRPIYFVQFFFAENISICPKFNPFSWNQKIDRLCWIALLEKINKNGNIAKLNTR
jgi:hypothetical protein